MAIVDLYQADLKQISSISGSFARTGLPQAVSAASYNANNELTQWGGSPIGYDANGNMTSDSTKTYSWDARNHLASIGGGVTASFQYDPFGRRVTKSVGGSATSYLYDGANAVQELSGSAPTANLLNAALDEVLTRSVATGTSSYLADALGNTVALADNVGAIQSQYNYEPFGQTTGSGAVNTNPVQYTGRENDVTGLYYYRARYYVPQIGRFISEDPLGFESGDANLYSYVRNSPTNLIDPSGLTWQTNWNFFTDWVLGRNPRTRNYGPNDVETQEMENSVGADRLRQFFYNKNCQDVTRYGYGTARAAWDTLLNPSTADWSSTGAQVGAWGPASAINNENGTVTFTIYNKAGTHSFFYHSVPDRSNPTGPMSNIYQTFQWTEPIPTGGRYGGCH